MRAFGGERSLLKMTLDEMFWATQYWQAHAVSYALRQHWLMCGLLALSACHLAALTSDTMIERTQRTRGAILS